MILLFKLYGERYCSQFYEAWFPLAYYVAMWGRMFKWGAIIANKLNIKIEQAHKT
jgi:hypothetical protein